MDNPKIKLSKKAMIITGVVVVVIAIVSIVWYMQNKKKKEASLVDGSGLNPGINSDGTINSSEISTAFFPLKKGDKNDYVTVWQKYLQKNGQSLSPYGADGDFGSITEAATMAVVGTNEVSLDLFKTKIITA